MFYNLHFFHGAISGKCDESENEYKQSKLYVQKKSENPTKTFTVHVSPSWNCRNFLHAAG